MKKKIENLLTDYCFTVLYEDEEVAKVEITNKRKNVHIDKLVPDSIFQPFGGTKLDIERVYEFLKDRC